MLGLKFCRICLDDNVRMHQILGSEVQDVYEKLKNKKVQEVGRLHFACYICYCQLKKCQQLVLKSQKSAELLRQTLPIDSEMHIKSISFSDRLKYGLVNSLMVAKLDSLKIPDYENILKIEIKCESDSNEVMVKDEPHDDRNLSSGHYEVCIPVEQDINNESISPYILQKNESLKENQKSSQRGRPKKRKPGRPKTSEKSRAEQRRDANRRYRQTHPEVVRNAQKRYADKHREVHRAAVKRYAEKNPDIDKRSSKLYYARKKNHTHENTLMKMT